MPFKLSKAQQDQRHELAQKLAAAYSRVEEAVSSANEAITNAVEEANAVIARYNEALEEARAFVTEVRDSWRSDYDEKSEQWQSSDKGSSVNELIDAWDSFEPDNVEDFEVTTLEAPDSVVDDLEQLQGEAE